MLVGKAGSLILLGLSRKNIEELMKGRPIAVTREKHGHAIPDGTNIGIFFGETEDQMAEELKKHMTVHSEH